MSTYRTPFEALGEPGIAALSNAFFDIMEELGGGEVKELRDMHADDLGPMKIKLAAYLTGWMGGPPRYAEQYGGVCMTTPHRPYAIGPRERDQWLLCMEKALDRVGAAAELRAMLRAPLFRIADAVRNRRESATANDDPDLIARG